MKMIYKTISIIVLLSLFLIGCSKKESDNKYMQLYFINKEGNDIIKIVDKRYLKQNYNLDTAIRIISDKAPDSNVKAILLGDVKINSVKQVDNKVVIDLSDKFNTLSLEQKNLVKACIVYNLVMVSGVDKVEIYIAGVAEAKDYTYTANSYYIMNDSINTDKQRTDAILYLLNRDKKKLVKTIRNITYNKDKLEMNIIGELIQGPNLKESDLTNPFPEDFKIYTAKTIDGICEVKMNNSLNQIESEKELKLAVYSIVNTLCSIPGIKGVQLNVDNEPGINWNKTKLYLKPLEKNDTEEIVIVPKIG